MPDFTELVRLLHARARRLRACPHDAADLAQETALKIWQMQRDGARMVNPQAYAMTALRNLAHSQWRNHRTFEELQDDSAITLPDAMNRLACDDLHAALSRLPRVQAEIMALVADGETSPRALARITSQPVGTVMSRLARARATLRKSLDPDATGR
jgi:RNA polymerase sigma-70 factor (ECF subfamily)